MDIHFLLLNKAALLEHIFKQLMLLMGILSPTEERWLSDKAGRVTEVCQDDKEKWCCVPSHHSYSSVLQPSAPDGNYNFMFISGAPTIK